MFERYTERARRVLFFARYEASQMGSASIDTEHLLLGLLREPKGVIGVIFTRAHIRLDRVARKLQRKSAPAEKISTSVEIPFTEEAKAVLRHAAEEADQLLYDYIGPEHLLLGLLHERQSVAASTLREHGLDLEDTRQHIARIHAPELEGQDLGASDDDGQVAIDHLKVLVRRLAEAPRDSEAASELTDSILSTLDTLKDLLDE